MSLFDNAISEAYCMPTLGGLSFGKLLLLSGRRVNVRNMESDIHAKVMTLVPMDPQPNPGEEVTSAFISPIAAQQLMDQLWAGGIRPSEDRYVANSIEALQRHLEDMRKIAFKHVGIKEN